MTKRLLTALCALAFGALATPALAWPHHKSGAKYTGSAGTSRSCLKSSAQALLNRIEAQFGRVQIVSTCRPGARIAGTGRISKHASGEAIDFNAPGGKKAAIVKWLIANHKSGGTMTYAGMNHIHVDVGHHFVALYSGGRGGYRSSGRRAYASARSGRVYASARSRRTYASASSGADYYPESRSGLGMGSGRVARSKGFSDFIEQR